MIVQKVTKEQTYDLRKNVLRKDISLPHVFQGDDAEGAQHYGVFSDSKIVGIVSFIPKNLKKNSTLRQIQLRGMAVDSKFQGKGTGSLLLKEVIEIQRKSGVDLIWCNAREKAYDFYTKNGFTRMGKEFDIPQIGKHDIMFRELK